MATGRQWGVERAAITGAVPGCEVVRLTDSTHAGGYACHQYLNVPTFTHDGKQLVFISTRGAADPKARIGQNLFTCDLDSGSITQLTATGRDVRQIVLDGPLGHAQLSPPLPQDHARRPIIPSLALSAERMFRRCMWIPLPADAKQHGRPCCFRQAGRVNFV